MINKKEKMRKIGKGIATLFIVFVVGGIGGVYFDQYILPVIRTNRYLSKIDFLQRTAQNVTVINRTEQVTIKEDDAISEIASQASNAVVSIQSLSNQKDPITRTTKTVTQSGSGSIVSSDGLIATYRDAIIENNVTYSVFLFDGRRFDAKLVGIDSFTNIAYLRIDAPNLTAASFANSEEVVAGRKIIVIGGGSNEPHQDRYAAGIVSEINKTFNLAGKSVSSTESEEGVFVTDLGNLNEYIGGSVVGYSGDLVGIVGKVSMDGQTLYVILPANQIQQSIKHALENNFDRPVLGAYYVPITPEYAFANGLSQDHGARIFAPSGKQSLAMLAGSPAQQSGLLINDVITAVNDKQIDLNNPLSNVINQYKKGDTLQLTVDRAGQTMKITATL